MARILDTDGSQTEVKPSGDHFTLKELYQHIKTDMVEIIPLSTSLYMVLDENGKLNNRGKNYVATRMFHENVTPHDYIVGTVLLAHPNELQSDDE